jgi:hypothetical protein
VTECDRGWDRIDGGERPSGGGRGARGRKGAVAVSLL